MEANYGPEDDELVLHQFFNNLAVVGAMQGRIAYLFMSIHVIKPDIIGLITIRDPTRLLYANMIYGITILIYSRPNMRPIGFLNRVTFSFLGSLMFNYSSMGFFNCIKEYFRDQHLASFLCFLAGRFFMLHLCAYLYHIDVRGRDRSIPRNAAFDSMYISSH